MKKLFLVLLLANAAFFGWVQLSARNERARAELPPLNAEKIRLVDMSKEASRSALSAEPAKALPAPVSVPEQKAAPVLAPEQKTSPEPRPSTSPPVSALQPESGAVCLEWGDFSGTDLTRATAVLAELPLASKPGRREIEQDTGYWVYIPPLRNKAAVKKKIGELKELGVNEYFVVTAAGRWHNAVSLGVFKTPEAAQGHFDYLRTKGVRTARTGERASKLRMTRFVLNGVNPEIRAKLVGMQGDFAGSELKNVPCTLTR